MRCHEDDMKTLNEHDKTGFFTPATKYKTNVLEFSQGRILQFLKKSRGHYSGIPDQRFLVFKLVGAFINISNLSKFGKDPVQNEGVRVFRRLKNYMFK